MSTNEYERFLTTYSGKRLLEQYSLTETGLWLIRGEDPNCDWGGFHHQPILGYREGVLRDVIEEAVEMGGFWQWGSGGSIEKVSVKRASPEIAKARKELAAKRDRLQAQIEAINKELGEKS